MFVKPAVSALTGALLKVRHPRTKTLIPETGAEVSETFFWLRRLRDGDVVRVEPATGEVQRASQSAVPAAAPVAVPAPTSAAAPVPTLVTSQEQ